MSLEREAAIEITRELLKLGINGDIHDPSGKYVNRSMLFSIAYSYVRVV